MQHLVDLIEQYGLWVVFLNVLAVQSGIPLPAYPTLIVAGALLSRAEYPVAQLLLVAVLASLLADLGWYFSGARLGRPVMRTLCRISLSPDSCVRQTEAIYLRWGSPSLAVAKFIPGFGAVATALAGAMHTRLIAFVFFDAIGAFLWSGAAVLVGYLFRNAVNDVLGLLQQLGKWGLLTVVTLFALFVLVKWWQRQRFYRKLRMARVSVEELSAMLERGERPTILDVRSHASQASNGRIPGARTVSNEMREQELQSLVAEGEVIVYCACPNEASAALIAKKLLALGYTRVRPLKGGIDAWIAAGLAIEN
jgi:membrane protein DedA with SNARE-associated domain/rhodanese-related sulfurtransferase